MPKEWLKKYDNISISGLDPKITNYLGSLPPELQNEIYITATSGGKHTKGSLHYSNKAIDLRFSDKLYNYIVNDPARHEAGLTLIDPNHGTAKHIHLSNALGTKKEFYGEVDPQGRKKVYEQKGWDMNALSKQAVVPKTPSPQAVADQQFISDPTIEKVKPLAETTIQPVQDAQTIPNMQYENWNPYGWATGQILLNQEEPTPKKKKISQQEKAQLNVLLEQANPTLRSAIETIIDFDEESTPTKKRNTEDTPRTQSMTTTATPTVQSTGRSGQYNAGNLRNPDGSFKSFATPEEGRQALVNQLVRYQTGNNKVGVKPTNTLLEAMSVYAPASDNNNPTRYADFIAKSIGVSPSTQIKDIDPNAWADAVAKMEGNKSYLSSRKENGGWLDKYKSGGEISKSKAAKILHEGKIGNKDITDKQRKYFGYIASKKENGGWLNNY